jgi:O-antigen ligase
MTAGDAVMIERSRLPAHTSAAVLLGLAFVLSQWSDLVVARWSLRLLPVWALLLYLTVPGPVRARIRLPLALLAFLAWCLASYGWSADPGNSVRRLIDLTALVAVGWVAGSVLGGRRARNALARTVQGMLVLTAATMVIAPTWGAAPTSDGAPGWHGPFPHKNGLGFFCAFAAVTLWTTLPRGWPRRLWLGLVVVLLVGSQSASPLAALVVAASAMAWHTARSSRPVRGRLAADATAAGVLATIGLVALLWPGLLFGALGRDSSLTGRRAIWTAVEHWMGMRPLAGYGFGGVWEDPTAVTLAIWRESRFDAFYAHNGYLDIALQVGFVGLVLLVIVLVGLVVAVVRPARPAGSWPLGVLLLLLLTAISESAPFTGSGMLLLALLVAVQQTPVGRSAPSAGAHTPAAVLRVGVGARP